MTLADLSHTQQSLIKYRLSNEEYYRIVSLIGRIPNAVELAMFGAMWSEHCAYKNSKPLLRLLPTTSTRVTVLAGPGENAGIVEISPTVRIAFKIESHNRPTAIEPFQGATTGVGGNFRDILTLGARPIALLNSLHFGVDEHSDHLLKAAVSGIAHYGNCCGIPTVGGALHIEPCYNRNPLMNAMCIGLLELEHPMPSAANSLGASVVYVGAETGLDGIGGASFASAGLSSTSEQDRPAVQVGDPFKGKLLIESCLEAFKTGFVLAAQDMGAAGLTCAICEMAAKGKMGIVLNLDYVPSRGELTAEQFLISESQERMLFIVQRGREAEIEEIFSRWNLTACTVGQVVSGDRVKVLHCGDTVADLPAYALTESAPEYNRPTRSPKQTVDILGARDLEPNQDRLERWLLDRLSTPEFASRRWIYEQFDTQVGNDTVFKPGEADAALLRLRDMRGNPTSFGLACTVDCTPRYFLHNPRLAAQIAVAEAARNISTIGAEPLALTDNLNFGDPENPESHWKMREAVEGIAFACAQLQIPVVSGNVSMYNQHTSTGEILPSPVIGMIGRIDDYRKAVKIAPLQRGDAVWLIGDTKHEALTPNIDWGAELALHKMLREGIDSGTIKSAHDLSEGGLLMCLAEMILAGNLGLSVVVEEARGLQLRDILCGETQSRALVTTSCEVQLGKEEIKATRIGSVTGERLLRVHYKGRGDIICLSYSAMAEAHASKIKI